MPHGPAHRSTGEIRRHPGRTAESVDTLRALAGHSATAARQFENFIRREGERSDPNGQQKFERSVILCDPHDLETLAEHEIARWTRGAGGGRKRVTDDPLADH